MLEEAKKFTKEHHMIEEGSRVIAGVSGGADSVCLLLLSLIHISEPTRPY